MQPATFGEFWPYYLTQHAKAATRTLHVVGTAVGSMLLVVALVSFKSHYALAAPFVAYAFAWLAHGFVEHNRPATFRHPWWSLVADYKMCWLWLVGGLDAELAKAGVPRG